jgi:hypothetical protein
MGDCVCLGCCNGCLRCNERLLLYKRIWKGWVGCKQVTQRSHGSDVAQCYIVHTRRQVQLLHSARTWLQPQQYCQQMFIMQPFVLASDSSVFCSHGWQRIISWLCHTGRRQLAVCATSCAARQSLCNISSGLVRWPRTLLEVGTLLLPWHMCSKHCMHCGHPLPSNLMRCPSCHPYVIVVLRIDVCARTCVLRSLNGAICAAQPTHSSHPADS